MNSAIIEFADKKYQIPFDLLDKAKEFYTLFQLFEEYTVPNGDLSVGHSSYSIDDMYTLFEKTYRNDSKITLRNNISSLRVLLGLLGVDKVCITDFLMPERIVELLKSKNYQKATIKNHLHTVVKMFRLFGEVIPRGYEIEIGILIDDIQKNKSFQATDKESKVLKYLENNIETIREKLNIQIRNSDNGPKKFLTYMKMVLFTLYVDCPPLRRDWMTVKYRTENLSTDSQENYYNVHTTELTLNSFKNRKSYGKPMKFLLSDYPVALDAMNKWIEIHPKLNNGCPLFLNKRRDALKGSSFNVVMEEIFNIRDNGGNRLKISCNILRKHYIISNILNKTPKPEKIAEIHRIMCHSASTALKEYSKNI